MLSVRGVHNVQLHSVRVCASEFGARVLVVFYGGGLGVGNGSMLTHANCTNILEQRRHHTRLGTAGH